MKKGLDDVSGEDREKVRLYVFTRLKKFYPAIERRDQLQNANYVEQTAFEEETSRAGYLQRITRFLGDTETQSENGHRRQGQSLTGGLGETETLANSSRSSTEDSRKIPILKGAESQHSNASPDDWQVTISEEEREKIYGHIKAKLCVYYSLISKQVIQEKSIELEHQAFNTSTSRLEYVNVIARELSRAEHYYNARNRSSDR